MTTLLLEPPRALMQSCTSLTHATYSQLCTLTLEVERHWQHTQVQLDFYAGILEVSVNSEEQSEA